MRKIATAVVAGAALSLSLIAAFTTVEVPDGPDVTLNVVDPGMASVG